MTELWLARHGETEWSLTRRHTGRTDIDLTERGERQAAALGRRLAGEAFELVLSSPAKRARRTAQIAGLGGALELDEDLQEWDYGDYDGVTTADIRRERPGWDLWRDGCPGGEQLADVAARAERVAARVRERAPGRAILFGHGHMTRVVATRWLGVDPLLARHLVLHTGTLSVVGSEHARPAIELWNAAEHLLDAR